MRANKPPDGYLFAIVNSLDTVVQLGLKVSLTNNNNLNVSLVYNDPATQTPSDSLVSFTLPYEPKLWINFAMQVMNDRVILYHNCLKVQEANVTKEPKELIFESASTFYLAQAGNSGGLKHKFEVSLKFTFIVLLKFVNKKKNYRCLFQRVINLYQTFCIYLPGKSKQFPGLIATHAQSFKIG